VTSDDKLPLQERSHSTQSKTVNELARQLKSTNELAEDRTVLAVKRTVMGADRTLMAWLRTALSMISFGFTIYKILEGLQGSDVNLIAQQYEPRTVGLFLVGLGTMSMVMGTIEYWFSLRGLQPVASIAMWKRPAFIMALLVSWGGLVVFVSIVANLI
jgi:putative membrane protein